MQRQVELTRFNIHQCDCGGMCREPQPFTSLSLFDEGIQSILFIQKIAWANPTLGSDMKSMPPRLMPPEGPVPPDCILLPNTPLRLAFENFCVSLRRSVLILHQHGAYSKRSLVCLHYYTISVEGAKDMMKGVQASTNVTTLKPLPTADFAHVTGQQNYSS